jgi:Transglutaminase-like superfamily
MRQETSYYLSSHVYCCAFSDGAIFLNSRTGDYLGIDSEYLPALIANIADWPTAPSPRVPGPTQRIEQADQLIANLHERGILATTASSRPTIHHSDPLISLSAIGRTRSPKSIPMRHRITFIASLVRVLIVRRKDRLEPIINWLQRRQAALDGCRPTDLEHISFLLSSFERMRVWFYTANKKCLLDSLVLSVYLSLARQSCTFVIAVATKPFLAHSWVQVGQAVLNDTVEHVQIFRPIIVVG